MWEKYQPWKEFEYILGDLDYLHNVFFSEKLEHIKVHTYYDLRSCKLLEISLRETCH